MNKKLFLLCIFSMLLMTWDSPCYSKSLKNHFKTAIQKGRNNQGFYVLAYSEGATVKNKREVYDLCISEGYVPQRLEIKSNAPWDNYIAYVEFKTVDDYFQNDFDILKMSPDDYLDYKLDTITLAYDGTYSLKVGIKDFDRIYKKTERYKIVKHEQLGRHVMDGVKYLYTPTFYPTCENITVLPKENTERYAEAQRLENYYKTVKKLATPDAFNHFNRDQLYSYLNANSNVKNYPDDVMNKMVDNVYEYEIKNHVLMSSTSDERLQRILDIPEPIRNNPKFKQQLFDAAKTFFEEKRFNKGEYYTIYHDYSSSDEKTVNHLDSLVYAHIADETEIIYYINLFPQGLFINQVKQWYDNGSYEAFYNELSSTLLQQYIDNCKNYMTDYINGTDNQLFHFDKNYQPLKDGILLKLYQNSKDGWAPWAIIYSLIMNL